jgi:hypothetical protein
MTPSNTNHNYINGAISGLLTVIITQPFQVIRTSMMVTYMDKKPSGFSHIIKRLYYEEGIKGFYRGVIPTAIKTPLSTSIYFGILEKNKILLSKSFKQSHNISNLAASGIAITVQCIVTNPMVLIITRYEVIGFKSYNSTLHAFGQIKKNEGFKGYFKGLKPSLMKEVPTGAMFYSLYEIFKSLLCKKGVSDLILQTWISAMASTFILTIINNPFDVIRTRMQFQHFSKNDQHNYKSVFSDIFSIAKNEGMRGLTVGIIPRMLKRSTGSAIAWSCYESLKKENNYRIIL